MVGAEWFQGMARFALRRLRSDGVLVDVIFLCLVHSCFFFLNPIHQNRIGLISVSLSAARSGVPTPLSPIRQYML